MSSTTTATEEPESQYEDLAADGLDDFVTKTLRDFKASGIAIAMIHHDKTYAKGWGEADRTNHTPVTPHTFFFTGSTTKSFTAAMAAHVIGRETTNPTTGEPVTWRTPLADLIGDDCVLGDDYATTHVSIEDALSHRTGMPRHDAVWIFDDLSFRRQVRVLRYLPLRNELRVEFEYCNVMITAVAFAIARVVGTEGNGDDFKRLAKAWVFDPLGMGETFYDWQDVVDFIDMHKDRGERGVIYEAARGYYWDEDAEVFRELPFEDIPPTKGKGGMISNVLDYTKWLRHLSSNYSASETDLAVENGQEDSNSSTSVSRSDQELPDSSSFPGISKAAVQAMITPRCALVKPILPCFKGTSAYGLGLFLDTYRNTLTWWHNGSLYGYNASILVLPEHNWGIVTMQNTESPAHDVVRFKLLDDFLDSIGKPGPRFDMATHSRRMEKGAKAKLTSESVLKRLFPDLNEESNVYPPVLPLESYEGVYRHPAYSIIRISKVPSERHASQAASGEQAKRLYLFPASESAFLDVHATLHHVSAEQWWAYQTMGPAKMYYLDQAKKVRFDVGADGSVKGVRFQVEPAIDGEMGMALFEKVE